MRVMMKLNRIKAYKNSAPQKETLFSKFDYLLLFTKWLIRA